MLTEGRASAALVLGLLATATVVAMVLLAHQWVRGRSLLNRRQVLLRSAAGGVLLGVWFLLGLMLLRIRPLEQPQEFLVCFYSTLLLCVLLAVLAAVDLRVMRIRQRGARRKLAEDFQRLQSVTTERKNGR